MSYVIQQTGAGPGSKVGTEQIIDALRGSARITVSPLDHSDINGTLLGYYGVAQASGATVSLGAAAHLASLRWTDPSRFLVLIGIRAGWTINGAVTAATQMDLQAVVARGFSVDFTTNSTAASLVAANTNKFRSNMGASLLGANGPRIATTGAMSGQTLTADANPFAMAPFANQPSGNATVTQAVGVGHSMVSLYEYTALKHPIILSANEGILIQPVTAGPVSGSVKYYIEWNWAEIALF